jgi:4-hydroxy-2-oxoglutarate aldolase
MTSDALEAHFRHVADESPIPVVLYNIPKYVGFAIPAALVADLAAHPNVIGIKDSSGDRDQLAAYLKVQADGFSVLTGSGTAYQASMAAGARGGILAVALFAPEASLAVYDASGRADIAAALAAQARLTPLGATVVGSLGVAGVKAALDLVGLRCARCSPRERWPSGPDRGRRRLAGAAPFPRGGRPVHGHSGAGPRSIAVRGAIG